MMNVNEIERIENVRDIIRNNGATIITTIIMNSSFEEKLRKILLETVDDEQRKKAVGPLKGVSGLSVIIDNNLKEDFIII